MQWRRVWQHLFFCACLLYGGRVYAADNTQLLEAALRTVHDEFLAPVSYDIYSSWAVQGLNQYDKNLQIVDDESRITLYYNSQVFRSYLKPQGKKSENPKAWARFMLKVLDAAKEISPAVKQKDFEAPDKMLQFATQNLDPYSKYISVLAPEKKQDLRPVSDFGVNLTTDDILYIKLTDITKFTPHNFEAAFAQYANQAKALIIDLRGCHGGALQGAIDVADLFLPNGIITSTQGRKDDSVVFYEAHPDVLFAGKPIVVLVDGETASSAEILAAAFEKSTFWGVWMSLVAGLTAFYMFRLYYNIFWGKEAHHEHTPHEAPKTMSIPLIFLALVTCFAGFIPFGHFVTASGLSYTIHLNWAVAGTSIGIAIVGIALATWLYMKPNDKPARMAQSMSALHRWAYHRFYIDEVYMYITHKIIFRHISTPIAWFDRHVVDGTMNLMATLTQSASYHIRGLQSGRLQSYAVVFLLGAMIVAFVVLCCF